MAPGKRQLPFSVNRNDARSLIDQVADGIREAIVGGYYKAGEAIPSSRELEASLGVSRIVPKIALARLAEEGYLVSRHGMRMFVRDRAAKQWLGHVVMVCPEGDDNYFQAVLSGTLRDRLLESGYMFTQVLVRRSPDGKPDFSHLDAVLSHSTDLVVALFMQGDTSRHLLKSKVPFAAIWNCPRQPVGAVGFTHLDYTLASDDFASECVRLGVRECIEVYWVDHVCDVAPACRKAGIRTRKIRVPVDISAGRIAAVKQAGFDLFASLASSGKISKDAVYFVADDYLASGAFLALALAGLKIPDDVRLATWSNVGLGQIYPKDFSRMEMDPVAASSTIASAALEYLKTGKYPSGGVIGPRWIAGETIGRQLPVT